MIWAPSEASEKVEAKVENRLSKARAKVSQFFSRISPTFGSGLRMKKSPNEAPVMNGIVKGADQLGGDISGEFESSELKGIPTVNFATKSSQMITGRNFLSKIKDSLLAPFQFNYKKRPSTRGVSSVAGKRAEMITTLHRGRPWGWKIPKDKPADIHLPATIRAAARNQKNRNHSRETALNICLEDVREKVRIYKAPMTLVFVIDLSGSMTFAFEEAKEALLKLHRDAYRYRDKVGIVALKETRAVVVQHPITNLGVVANKLMGLKVSGHTPLAAGMLKAWEVLKEARRRDRSTIPVMVVITDGNANVPLYRSVETGKPRKFDEMGIVVRQFEDLAVKDTVSVSKLIKKEGIHTVVVNTNPHYAGRETYGLVVTKVISSATDGSHHQVSRSSIGKDLVEEIFEGISEDQKKIDKGLPLSQLDLWR